jgi:hypothetical protein
MTVKERLYRHVCSKIRMQGVLLLGRCLSPLWPTSSGLSHTHESYFSPQLPGVFKPQHVYNKQTLQVFSRVAALQQNDTTIYSTDSPNANCPICQRAECTDNALHILSGCQHTNIRISLIKIHIMANALILFVL